MSKYNAEDVRAAKRRATARALLKQAHSMVLEAERILAPSDDGGVVLDQHFTMASRSIVHTLDAIKRSEVDDA